MLRVGASNVVTLYPPSAGTISVMPDHAPPTKVHRIMAAPSGGDYIPEAVLADLAEANGMNAFQLHGTSRDGTVVLPEFLPHGQLDLSAGSGAFLQRIGSITVPLREN